MDDDGGGIGGADPCCDDLGTATKAEWAGFILIAATSFGLLELLSSVTLVETDWDLQSGLLGFGRGTSPDRAGFLVTPSAVQCNEMGEI